MADLDLKYIAGLFDGEGCIHIDKHEKPCLHYSLVVHLTNSNAKVIKKVRKTIGFGCIQTERKTKKIVYIFRLCSRQAKSFLVKVYPYLEIKKEQTKLAIEYQSKKPKRGQKTFDKSLQLKYRERINSFNSTKGKRSLKQVG